MNKLYTTFYALAWSILAVFFGWAVAPTVETLYFPVYSKFELVSAEQIPEGVLAVFEFTKNRECAPKGLSWYLGEVGASTSITITTPEGVRSPRPVGLNTSSPYLFEGVTLEDLDKRIIAQIRNQCDFYGFQIPWLSVSDVYP